MNSKSNIQSDPWSSGQGPCQGSKIEWKSSLTIITYLYWQSRFHWLLLLICTGSWKHIFSYCIAQVFKYPLVQRWKFGHCDTKILFWDVSLLWICWRGLLVHCVDLSIMVSCVIIFVGLLLAPKVLLEDLWPPMTNVHPIHPIQSIQPNPHIALKTTSHN